MTNAKQTYNEELKSLIIQKQNLIRLFNRHEIVESDYLLRLNKLEDNIRILTEKSLNELYQKRIEKEQKEIEEKNRRLVQMSEIKTEVKATPVAKEVKATPVAKEQKVKTPKTSAPKKVSRAAVILEVLGMKSIKSLDAAVSKVIEKMPDQKPANVKSQIGTIIKLVQAKKSYFGNYTWDENNFQLTKNQ